jgi:hypothetical protein
MRARSLEFSELNVEYGYGYNSAAVVPDGTPAPVQLDDIRIYEPSTRPGAPLPHGWIDDEDGNRRPIEDLVIPGRFLLIAGENGQAWCEAARDSLPRPNFRSTRCGSVTSTAISTTRAACGCASARSHLTAQSSYARTGSLRGDTRPRPRTRGRRSRLRSARSSCIPPSIRRLAGVRHVMNDHAKQVMTAHPAGSQSDRRRSATRFTCEVRR